MEAKAPLGLAITTYEFDDKNLPVPVLTHIFWGKDLKEAYDYAKSHLVTDYFFSGTFTGGINWKGTFLELDYDGEVVDHHTYQSSNGVSEIMDKLKARAMELNKKRKLQQLEIL